MQPDASGHPSAQPEHGDAREPPEASPEFRRRAWREFQRAIDPLARPKPLPPPRQH